MMNILYTHAHKPNFRRGFGAKPAETPPASTADGLDPRVRGGAGPIPGVARDS